MVQTSSNTDNEKANNKPQQSALDQLVAFFKNIKNFFVSGYYKASNIEKANMEVGIRQMKNGDHFDAAWRFKIVILLNKNNGIAHYLLGKCNFYRGKYNEAIKSLNRALQLKPDLDEARFLLAASGKKPEIKAIPRSFILEKLDFMATRYDEFIENTSSHVNSALAEEINKIVGENMGFNVIDLGSRGGDASQFLRSRANSIVGVEPSLKMVSLARNRRVNDLLTFNLIAARFPEDYLKEVKDKFAVAISTYYLENLGSLDEYFKLVSNAVDKGGLFAFNINQTGTSHDYAFKPASLIFTHSRDYISKLAAANGFKIIVIREVKYPSESIDILYVLEKQ